MKHPTKGALKAPKALISGGIGGFLNAFSEAKESTGVLHFVLNPRLLYRCAEVLTKKTLQVAFADMNAGSKLRYGKRFMWMRAHILNDGRDHGEVGVANTLHAIMEIRKDQPKESVDRSPLDLSRETAFDLFIGPGDADAGRHGQGKANDLALME